MPSDVEAINVVKGTEHSIEHFYVPERFKPYLKNIMIPDGVIKARCTRLAERIIKDYSGEKELILLVMMDGAYKFYEELKQNLN